MYDLYLKNEKITLRERKNRWMDGKSVMLEIGYKLKTERIYREKLAEVGGRELKQRSSVYDICLTSNAIKA